MRFCLHDLRCDFECLICSRFINWYLKLSGIILLITGTLFKTRCTQCHRVEENRNSPIVPALLGKGYVFEDILNQSKLLLCWWIRHTVILVLVFLSVHGPPLSFPSTRNEDLQLVQNLLHLEYLICCHLSSLYALLVIVNFVSLGKIKWNDSLYLTQSKWNEMLRSVKWNKALGAQ